MQQPASPLAAPRPGLSGGVIKLIAIAAMFIDHAALAFLPDYFLWPALPLHMIGRITGPVMFFFIAEGYHHTRNRNSYTLRLALFAAVSYLPFVWFKTGQMPGAENWMELNVIYTLLCGHLALRARHEIKSFPLRLAAVLACLVASYPGDWSWLAVLFILLFDHFRGNFRHQALAYTVVTLTQLLPVLFRLFDALSAETSALMLSQYVGQVLVYAAYFLPLLPLRLYNGQKGPGGKYLFYVFYPAHLLLLAAMRAALAAGL